ncbi:arsenic resistance N-acetyltransferase ArsN2 [Mucilaginibacter litoreus]|uniref:Arsenic resistance N-acetyltransferase ArsN2 n=1 Tax=Mucilaginibacter litoreus TaxID=1048221 RepID=A0ABW3AS27_9SPHI
METEIKPAELYKDDALILLLTENLPAVDFTAITGDFYVALSDNKTIGVIGLEVYSNYGLLRSLAVSTLYRNKGIASQLVKHIEELAANKGLVALYLFTTTAKDYFKRIGYEHIARMDLPEAIKTSDEFTHLCPDTAIAMQKSIDV